MTTKPFPTRTTVVQRGTGKTFSYQMGPRTAVLYAYVQYEARDHLLDTKDYWEKYGHLLVETPTEFQMGQFYVQKGRKKTPPKKTPSRKKAPKVPEGQGSLF